MPTSSFLTEAQVRHVQQTFGTPVFVYSEAALRARAAEVLAFPAPYGLTARFAMKSLPSAAVVQVLHESGLGIDASSGYEAARAMRAGVPAGKIQITAQELPRDLTALLDAGVRFNACSLHQLRIFGALRHGSEVGLRINPGLGSGHSNRTNVGGPSSSFGLWHEHLDEALTVAAAHGLRITMMHTHIGSGSDPEVWLHCARLSLGIAARLPDVTTLSLGGGFKVARMPGEVSADLAIIGGRIAPEIEAFAREHGRRLHLEIEPGTYLVALAGALVSSTIDVVDTGQGGMRFIKLDTGMTEILRPSLYGAQHPISAYPAARSAPTGDFVVVGHCCESGDILSPEPGNPEGLKARSLAEPAPGDPVLIEGAGAYCSAMPSKNYNSFPECAEVMLRCSGEFQLIRRRQTLDQMLQNELPLH
jgi:diaminopimelate decarboxylase